MKCGDLDIFVGGIWVVMFWVFMFMMLRYDDGLPIAIISDVPLLRWGIFRFFRVGVFTVGIHLVTYLL